MYGLSQQSLPTVILVVLTVVAVGALGATVDSVVGADSGAQVSFEPRDAGGGPDAPDINTSDIEGNRSDISQQRTIDLSVCVTPLTNPPAILGIFTAVSGLLYASYRRFNAAAALLIGTGVIPVVWLSYFLLTNCASGGSGGGGGFLNGASVVSNQGGLSTVSVPPTMAAAALGLVVVAGIAALVRTTGEEETFEPLEDETGEEPDASEFAAAAGRAADRIEQANAPVDNAVYRAWYEMTGLVDIDDPETTSPRGFAQHAIEAGLDEADVAELTELFNEVRYGGKTAENREDRALEILRNIEQTYGEPPDETGGNGGGS